MGFSVCGGRGDWKAETTQEARRTCIYGLYVSVLKGNWANTV